MSQNQEKQNDKELQKILDNAAQKINKNTGIKIPKEKILHLIQKSPEITNIIKKINKKVSK